MSAALRIGITCYPTFGGSGIIATELGVALARRGHQVHFICADVPIRLDRFVENVFFHGVEAHSAPPMESSPYTLALASKMVEVSTYERLDLLHVHYAVPHATSAYLARQILGGGPRLVTTLHGTDVTLVGNDPSFLPVTRFSILASDGLTAPSEALRRATHDELSIPATVPIEVIPNFVDTAVYHPAARSLERRTWLFPELPPEAALLFHSSNFREVKRVEDTVRILDEVRRVRSAGLVLVGDGPERSRVELLVRELGLSQVVRFLGKQLRFVEVLQQCDVFLLPSAMESFGLAALEALACGVPVVGSRVGGLPEVVIDAESGLLCPVGDTVAMATAVLQLLADRPRLAAMGEAAVSDVRARFQRDPIVDRYEAYFRRIL